MRTVVEIKQQDGSSNVVPDLESAIGRLELQFAGGRSTATFAASYPALAAAGLRVPPLHVLSHLASNSYEGEVVLVVHDVDAHRNAGTAVASYALDGPLDPDTILSRAVLSLLEIPSDEGFEEEVALLEVQLVSMVSASVAQGPWYGAGPSDPLERFATWKPEGGILPDPETVLGSGAEDVRAVVAAAALERFRTAVAVVAAEAGVEVASAPSV